MYFPTFPKERQFEHLKQMVKLAFDISPPLEEYTTYKFRPPTQPRLSHKCSRHNKINKKAFMNQIHAPAGTLPG